MHGSFASKRSRNSRVCQNISDDIISVGLKDGPIRHRRQQQAEAE
jgi:hypothetical protein